MYTVGVYGTLRAGQSRAGVLDGSALVAQTRLEAGILLQPQHAEFPCVVIPPAETYLSFTKRHNLDIRGPIIDVYSVSSKTLRILDMIEGHPTFFFRENVVYSTYRRWNSRKAKYEKPVDDYGEAFVYFIPHDHDLTRDARVITNGDYLNPIYADEVLYNYEHMNRKKVSALPGQLP